ncbi:hypothetical protein PspTeo4_01480 [Pseudomonas sp. Teo4]|nr:hypothetical protein [Pseudomonas sp. Teo4]
MGSTFNSLVGLIILALDIWAILNVIKSGSEIGAKVLWILLIALLPVVGLIIWAIAGPGQCADLTACPWLHRQRGRCRHSWKCPRDKIFTLV